MSSLNFQIIILDLLMFELTKCIQIGYKMTHGLCFLFLTPQLISYILSNLSIFYKFNYQNDQFRSSKSQSMKAKNWAMPNFFNQIM